MSSSEEKVNYYYLWQKYKENRDLEARQELIRNYLHLVKYQADRVKLSVPNFIAREDLEGFGVIGLIDAVEKFDYQRGIKFSTYARRRIRGEILDHLRSLDWLPHSMRREGKKVKKAVERLTAQNGKRPGVDELSQELNMSKKKINHLYHKMYSAQWVSLSQEGEDGNTLLDLLPTKGEEAPTQVIQRKKAREILSSAIDKLKKDEKLILSLYYYEELTQQEISEIMDLSPARISQIHKKAVHRLRGFLSRKKEQFV